MKSVLLLRHADIEIPLGPAPDDWPINAAGQARAEELAEIVGATRITAVFASPASRTQQTVAPLLAKLNLPLRVPDPPSNLIAEILADDAGPVVLVVGHSNTVPPTIIALGALFPWPPITGHDDLFIVTVSSPGQAIAIRLKYGNHAS